MAGLVFFTWGEIFSLFPSTCTDTYGSKFATTNAGLLYTAKGTSAWVVPLASLFKDYTGSWHWVFVDRHDHEFSGRGAGAVRAQADAAPGIAQQG